MQSQKRKDSYIRKTALKRDRLFCFALASCVGETNRVGMGRDPGKSVEIGHITVIAEDLAWGLLSGIVELPC